MGAYEQWKMLDILSPVLGKVKINFTPDGQPKVYLVWEGAPQSPWISHVKGKDRACPLWKNIYFDYYGIVSKGCRSCWKVVMAIPTVRQALRIQEWQTSCKYDCKVGNEARPSTGKLGKFGAYWYAPVKDGLKGGREMYSWLQKQFPGVKLLLKRGCTEMEQRWSPSDQWDEFADKRKWDFYEELLNTLFVLEDAPFGMTPSMFHPIIKAHWVEWAFEHGDETYLDFVDKPFKEEYMTYHSSIHNEKDFIGSLFEPTKVEGRIKYGANIDSGTEAVGSEGRLSSVEDGAKKSSLVDGKTKPKIALLS